MVGSSKRPASLQGLSQRSASVGSFDHNHVVPCSRFKLITAIRNALTGHRIHVAGGCVAQDGRVTGKGASDRTRCCSAAGQLRGSGVQRQGRPVSAGCVRALLIPLRPCSSRRQHQHFSSAADCRVVKIEKQTHVFGPQCGPLVFVNWLSPCRPDAPRHCWADQASNRPASVDLPEARTAPTMAHATCCGVSAG